MHQTPARPPHRPRQQRPPASPEPEPDLLATVVRGGLVVVLGCGGTMFILMFLGIILSLFLG